MSADQAAALRQHVLDLPGLDPDTAARVVAAIDRETKPEGEWRFVQLNVERNEFVTSQLVERSIRPHVALRLWSRLPLYLSHEDNRLLVDRAELAEALNLDRTHVSHALAELAEIGAITREPDPADRRRLRLTLNPLVGTHTTGMTRALLQQQAPELRELPTKARKAARSKGKPPLRLVETAPAE